MHWIDPNYFRRMSFNELEKFGIQDVYHGKLLFKDDKVKMDKYLNNELKNE